MWFCYALDPCNSGDIRLWGGQTEYEGNIELCTDHGVWSVVSDNSWGNAEAVVACRQLGYSDCGNVQYVIVMLPFSFCRQ